MGAAAAAAVLAVVVAVVAMAMAAAAAAAAAAAMAPILAVAVAAVAATVTTVAAAAVVAAAKVSNEILPQLVYSLSEQNVQPDLPCRVLSRQCALQRFYRGEKMARAPPRAKPGLCCTREGGGREQQDGGWRVENKRHEQQYGGP